MERPRHIETMGRAMGPPSATKAVEGRGGKLFWSEADAVWPGPVDPCACGATHDTGPGQQQVEQKRGQKKKMRSLQRLLSTYRSTRNWSKSRGIP